jgi:hypothetical protein
MSGLVEQTANGTRPAVGRWITTLRIAIKTYNDENEDISEQHQGYLLPILTHSPNLQTFELRHASLRVDILDPLHYANRTCLAHLVFTVRPTHLQVLSLVDQLKTLQTLAIVFEATTPTNSIDGDSLTSLVANLVPLRLPLVRKFTFGESLDENAHQCVLKYVARFQFREDCEFYITMWLGEDTISLLDPLFESHASSSIDLTLEADMDYLSFSSTIFCRSLTVKINRVPPSDLFKAARLPSVIELCVYQAEELFREVLDVLLDSPYDHDLRLKVSSVYPEFFLWESDWPWSDQYGRLCAEFAGSLLSYVRPLSQKGITIIDESGKSFRDQFIDLLT